MAQHPLRNDLEAYNKEIAGIDRQIAALQQRKAPLVDARDILQKTVDKLPPEVQADAAAPAAEEKKTKGSAK